MKTLLTTFITVIVFSGIGHAQRSFKFNIDHQEYQIDEKSLNDLFGNAFNNLVQKGWADEKHFDLWVSSYNDWKDHIVTGVFNWETYGNRVASSSFTGDIPPEYLGWRASGKDATGNPNMKGNIPRRMALIRDALSNLLIYQFTHKVIIN